MRKPMVVGNWKMNRTVRDALALVSEIEGELAGLDAVEVVICPPFTALQSVGNALAAGRLHLGAQNVHTDPDGPFTGEISASMLDELSCRYVIVGHSERRTHFRETDEVINRKVKAVLAGGMRPILCVGETLREREDGRTEEVLGVQIDKGLEGLKGQFGDTVVAYEPVWAIGTGRTATVEQAQSAHTFIRETLASDAGGEAAGALRILYGGSANPSNARELFAGADVDGGLIGGASLEARSFAAIVRAAT